METRKTSSVLKDGSKDSHLQKLSEESQKRRAKLVLTICCACLDTWNWGGGDEKQWRQESERGRERKRESLIYRSPLHWESGLKELACVSELNWGLGIYSTYKISVCTSYF